MSLIANSENYNDTWLFDSGASNHMSRNNLKIVDVEVFIVKLGWQGIDDQSDLIKVKFNVCN